ncbi:peptidase C14 [Rhizoctonia solani]|uniref:Peptidase C14 n=1 Tax=Rhizoctonia solani TaxID=456999 RepID=A0A8H8SXX7_9AGAM|nr:peptidase C14 [Rhizoctonia solani]QRW22601.1 peptidase C14 [Rhizoctonia solani]
MADTTSNPFVMLLRESLARAKSKFKRRLQLGKEHTGPTPSPTKVQRLGQADLDAWPLIKASITALESGADWFGPLKAAIGPLVECVEIYEREWGMRKEQHELRKKLDRIMQDLTELKRCSAEFAMTGSIQRIIDDIQEEAEMINEANQKAISAGRRLKSMIEGTEYILECYSRIDEHLQRLALNVNINMINAVSQEAKELRLAKVLSAESAFYDSGGVKRGRCAPETRKPQIDLLLQWASNPDSGRTCWMNGMAGTGKTTIAYTVCERLGSQLGASFFCSRTISECRQVNSIIPCIAYQLARFSAPFGRALDSVLKADPDVHRRNLKQQYEKLICEPLAKEIKSMPPDVIVVIDALDECEDPESVEQILDLLLSPDYKLPIRYLVSSRPEKEICARMAARTDGCEDTPLVLHDLESEAVKADIAVYMRGELKNVPLSEDQWSGILEQCGVLFIYASTTCRFILQGHRLDTLDEVVSAIIESSFKPARGGNPIDSLYLTILRSAFGQVDMSEADGRRMRDLLETVVCAVEPMKLETIASMLELRSVKHVHSLLQPLRSILNIAKGTGKVSTLHASFPDFILSHDRSSDFWCDRPGRHAAMAEACLRIIGAAEPKVNICGLPSSYLLDTEVEDLDERVRRAISPGLAYACQHWSTHLYRGEHREALVDRVRTFFFYNLLLWMEVVNLLKKIRHGTGIIQQAEKWCTKYTIPEDVSRIAHDAVQFVSVYANHPISESTPHIYISMLPFWPPSRPVSTAYMPRSTGLVKPQGTAISQRTLSLLATWKVSGWPVKSMGLSADGARLAVPTESSIDVLDTSTGEVVFSLTSQLAQGVDYIAMSPDGTQVAFDGTGDTLQLWNVSKDHTTTELLPSTGSGINSVAFSSNASHVACGLKNGDIYICSLRTAEPPLGPLEGHTNQVSSVTFSPDCLHLASGSHNNTVCIWDVRTGHSIGQPFTGHTRWVTSVSYSPDGSRLVSASWDCTIRVWDIRAAQTVLGPLKAHSSLVTSATFSPNAAFIASASFDNTIRVYDALTGGTVLGPLQAHTGSVNWVIFSPDGSRLFSCSNDGTVRIWNVQDAAVSNALPPATGPSGAIYSVRYSHSGLRVVSGSWDGAVHVWNAETGKLVLGPLSGHDKPVRSVDYSPSGRYVASASWDRTLRIWDADTGQEVHGPMESHDEDVNCVRFSPDESTIVSGSHNGTVRLWDVKTGQCMMQLLKGGSAILSVGFSPDGQHVVSGSGDGKIRVIDRWTGNTVVGPVHGHSGIVRSVEFSPNGMQIVSGSNDKSVRVWDAQTGLQVVVCGGDRVSHDYYVTSVGFSPNGLYIVSGSWDKTVCVWDAQTGKMLLGPLRRHTNVVECVQFSPDSSHVVSCSDDRTIRFWDVSSCAMKSQTQEEAGGESQTAHPGQDLTKALDSWTLHDEGWAVDSENRRLVWVPSDLRVPLPIPPNDLTISDQGGLRLDFDGAMEGETWTGCFRI